MKFHFLYLILPVLILLTESEAHQGCGGNRLRRSSIEPRLRGPNIAATTNASISSGICQTYTYPLFAAIANQFPPSWAQAKIVKGDTEATSLFNAINAAVTSKFPNIKPVGTISGDISKVKYNTDTDPNCWWTQTGCNTPNSTTGLVPDTVDVPEGGTFGLTFDDGPSCQHNTFYDYLLSQNQKATMFYVGSNIRDWPLEAIRGYQDGHQICIHTWSHLYMTALSNQAAFAELYYTRKIIKSLLGVTPQCWRPPFGDVDNRIRMIAAGLNLTTIGWNEDTDDWSGGTGGVTQSNIDANYAAIISKQKNGTYTSRGPIVLAHELENFTMSEAIRQYPLIKAAFKYVVPIATAYNLTTPYFETNVTFPSFAEYTSGRSNISVVSIGITPVPSSTIATPSTSSTASLSISSSALSCWRIRYASAVQVLMAVSISFSMDLMW